MTRDDDNSVVREVLSRYGVADAVIEPISSGRVNRHWRVDAGQATNVLRQYNAQRTPGAISYEHAMLARAHERG